MPIRVSLDRILIDRRMSLTELADRVGVTIANLSILKTGKGDIVEIQATGEKRGFTRPEFEALFDLARQGISELQELQRQAVA